MGFRLVPKSVTLNDLERRNGRCVISRNSVAFAAYYVKWLKIDRYIPRVKCSPKNLVFGCISFMATFAGIISARALKCRAILSLAKI